MSLKLKYLPHVLLALLALLLAWPALATTTTPTTLTDGQVALKLSENLICDTKDIVSGPLGLMAGFLLAAYGLYIWIRQDAMKTALIYIICGAFLTALPGLIFTFLGGVSALTVQSGMSTIAPTFPACTGTP